MNPHHLPCLSTAVTTVTPLGNPAMASLKLIVRSVSEAGIGALLIHVVEPSEGSVVRTSLGRRSASRMSHITTIERTVSECDVPDVSRCVTVTNMIIEVTEETVRVREPDDLKRLHAEFSSIPPSAAAANSLVKCGLAAAVEGDHILVFASALRELAGQSATALDWSDSYQGMIDYAAGKGWYDSASATIRVHIEVATTNHSE